MISNREIRSAFSMYAELLLLHETDVKLSGMLSGAAFRIRRMNDDIIELSKAELANLFRPQIVSMIEKLKKTGTIDTLDELVQLTPPGLFEMMRIRGLGGKKLAVLWKQAKIDTIELLLKACKADKVAQIPGFGSKTQANIILALENYSDNKERFHYGFIADTADAIVTLIQQGCKSKLVSLCGEVRRQSTTIGAIEIIAAVTAKKLKSVKLQKLMIVQDSKTKLTTGYTHEEVPVIIYHTSPEDYYNELFVRTGSEGHVKKVIFSNWCTETMTMSNNFKIDLS